MNDRNSKNGKDSNGVVNSKRNNGIVGRKRSNGIVERWSNEAQQSNNPKIHQSIPSPLRSAFSLIEFIGRLANLVLGCLSRRDSLKTARRFKAGKNLEGTSPAGTADSAAAPALGRLAMATSEFQRSLRGLSAARVQPGVPTPGHYPSSLRDRRPARRRMNCRNGERSVKAVNRLNRFNR